MSNKRDKHTYTVKQNKIEHVSPRGKHVAEFTDQLKVKRNDVTSIMGKPNYWSYEPVLDVVEIQLINMKDPVRPFKR